MRGTVLVVDDDSDVRRCLGEFLEAEGYRVLSAPHGRAALAILEEELPSLLLIDVQMPVMGGWKLLEALAHYPDLARIPRILMGEGEGESATARRAYRILKKPIDLDWLASAVESMVRSRAPAATAAA